MIPDNGYWDQVSPADARQREKKRENLFLFLVLSSSSSIGFLLNRWLESLLAACCCRFNWSLAVKLKIVSSSEGKWWGEKRTTWASCFKNLASPVLPLASRSSLFMDSWKKKLLFLQCMNCAVHKGQKTWNIRARMFDSAGLPSVCLPSHQMTWSLTQKTHDKVPLACLPACLLIACYIVYTHSEMKA